MGYTALYREWRPKTFDDVVGQEHITTTLKNEIINDRIAHAYLFCGTRGTGKTSTAKVMAKALNCLNLQDGEPCNECEMCKKINEGLAIDVTELDAASNNGIDKIRDIIDDTKYPPQEAKYKVYIMDDTAINAFATGRDPNHAVVCVTTGAITRLNKVELEGVLAHELSHIGNYDIRFMTLVVVLVGIITLLADWMVRSSIFGGRRRSNEGGQIFFFLGIILAILSPIFATLIKLAVSRKREFLADASGALLTRYPEGLASALEKIEADSEPLEEANKATAHLYIANPFKGENGSSWFANLFNTHPPTAERIRRLREMGH